MEIRFITIPHSEQRYDTVGDWIWEDAQLTIRVSRLPDRRYELLVFVHECIEALMCREAGVTQVEVDRFDTAYEDGRGNKTAPCGCAWGDEPGDDIHAPYLIQHTAASVIEMILAKVLGVGWAEYEEALEHLR